MMTKGVGLFVLSAACGRVGFDARDAVGEPGTPTNISILNSSATDDDPTVTADLLEMYFTSIRTGGAGGADLYRTTRAMAEDAWRAPELVIELDSASNEETAGIAADGLTIWFASDRLGAFDIYASTRAARGSPWSAPVIVAELSSTNSDQACEPSSSGLRIVCTQFASGYDLYEATRPDLQSAWSTLVPLTELNTADNELSPFLAAGDLQLLFATTRTGNREIMRATRPSVTQPFEPPVIVAALTTPDYEDDPWAAADGSYFAFASDRSGSLDVWEVRGGITW